MHGSLSEFTLAQLLQFFALAERSGTILVSSNGRQSRLLVEGDRIIGWGLPDFDAREALVSCELLPPATMEAIRQVRPRHDTPGLSFVIRNLVEPERWDSFAQRLLEQDIYPLLSIEHGDFEVHVQRCPPSPLRLSIPINSLILDGSRWESEMEAARLDGFDLGASWRRSDQSNRDGPIELSGQEWMLWATLSSPATIADIARRLCLPDLFTISLVRKFASMNLIERDG